MYNKKDTVSKKIFIKNMLGDCCIRLLRIDFEQAGITVHEIKKGYAEISYDDSTISDEKIDHILELSGLSRINGREQRLVEELKTAVYELIYKMNNIDSIAKKSEYIVEKLGLNYRYLSNLFSKYEPLTLEKYIIHHKIERIKQLIDEDDYTLSEIAYMMDYSSVQYLSNQFKKETGLTVTEYKNLLTNE